MHRAGEAGTPNPPRNIVRHPESSGGNVLRVSAVRACRLTNISNEPHVPRIG